MANNSKTTNNGKTTNNSNMANNGRTTNNGNTIQVTVSFWTNDIAAVKGDIVPKRAWAAGKVTMRANEKHGIKSAEGRPFTTMTGMLAALEAELVAQGIKLHVGGGRLYVKPPRVAPKVK